LGRWRKQLGEEGLEYLLTTLLDSALKMGAVKAESLAHVCVDSTVMEKNIAYPTDSNLFEVPLYGSQILSLKGILPECKVY